MNYATIDRHEVKPCSSNLWLAWYRKTPASDRVVAQTTISESPDVRILTIFTGVSPTWSQSAPTWFESMVYADPRHEDELRRYSTWDEALAGHTALVAKWESICWPEGAPDEGADLPDDHDGG